jgi:hypothetical protein
MRFHRRKSALAVSPAVIVIVTIAVVTVTPAGKEQ